MTYETTLPGFRAFGLEVGRVVARFDVLDYTGAATDRLQALRSMLEAAVEAACRRLAAEQPHLLDSTLQIPELSCHLPLGLPTWFTGQPPAALVDLVSTEVARALESAAGPALSGALTRGRAELAPDLALEVRPDYDEALKALKGGQFGRAARLYGELKEREAWAEAAATVAADLPAAASAVKASAPPPRPQPLIEAKPTRVIPLRRLAERKPAAESEAWPTDGSEERASAFRAALQAEAVALLAAPGDPGIKAVLLGALAGPLPDSWFPSAAQGSSRPEPSKAKAALEAYLGGAAPAEALKGKGGRAKWRQRNSGPSSPR